MVASCGTDSGFFAISKSALTTDEMANDQAEVEASGAANVMTLPVNGAYALSYTIEAADTTIVAYFVADGVVEFLWRHDTKRGMDMRNKENTVYIKVGVTAAAVVAFGLILFFAMYRSNGSSGVFAVLGLILRPFIIGGVLAYLVTPLSNRMVRLFGGKCQGLADLLALLIALIVVLAILLLIMPQLIQSVVDIVQALPEEIEALKQKIMALLEENPDLQAQLEGYYTQLTAEGNSILDKMKDGGGEIAGKAMQLVGGVANGAFSAFGAIKDLLIGMIVSLYFLSKRRQLAAQAKLVVRSLFKPEWAEWIEAEVRFTDRMFNGFFVGKLLDSAIVGVICFVGCLLMRFKSALLIAVIVGVTNIIPFFGPLIGAIPCALLLLLENPTHCLMFLIFIVLLQQLDGNVIGPKILGDSTGLSALWVMFGILLFGGLWGILGMLVGVPLMAVIYDIVRQVTFKGARRRGQDDMIAAYNAEFHPPVQDRKKKAGKH